MKFFVDTAEVSEIKALIPTGLVDGVTTNPSLVAKSGRDFREMIAEVCTLTPGPVSAEVTALETEQMVAEGKSLAKIAANVVVKLPLTLKGIAACKALTDDGVKTNVTLCFSANQALIAAKAGASNSFFMVEGGFEGIIYENSSNCRRISATRSAASSRDVSSARYVK